MPLCIILLFTWVFVTVSESIDDAKEHNYYDTLELPQSCSASDIKIAYRKLALQWHPDKNPNIVDEATSKFKKISEAYEVLSSPEKRDAYDKKKLVGPEHFESTTSRLDPQENESHGEEVPIIFVPRNPFDIFAEVFRDSDDPFEQFIGNVIGSMVNGDFQQTNKNIVPIENTINSEGRNFPLDRNGGIMVMPLHKIFQNRRKANQEKSIMNIHSYVIGQNGLVSETSSTETISENGHIMKHVEKKILGNDGQMHTEEVQDIDEGEFKETNFGGFGGNLLSNLFGGFLGGIGTELEEQADPFGGFLGGIGTELEEQADPFAHTIDPFAHTIDPFAHRIDPFSHPIEMEMISDLNRYDGDMDSKY